METADSIKQWELVGRFCNSLRKYTDCVSTTGKGDEFADLSPDMLALCEDGIGDLFIDCKYGRFIVKMLHECPNYNLSLEFPWRELSKSMF